MAPNVKQSLPTALEFGNSPNHFTEDKQSIQFINGLEYFLSTAHAGEHKFRLRDFVFLERDTQTTEFTGGGFGYEYIGTAPAFRTEYFGNDPRLNPGSMAPSLARPTASSMC